jgi:hypothetical protein
MSNEDIKFIAECLFPKSKKAFIDCPDEEKFEAFCDGIAARNFNPYESWADCGLVLEDMIKECEKRGIEIQIMNNQLRMFDGDCQLFTGDASREGICSARLTLLEGG